MRSKIGSATLVLGIAALAQTASSDLVEEGKKLVEGSKPKCTICHVLDGKGGKTGKPMNGIAEGKTDDQLFAAMTDPKKAIGPDTKMPSYKDKLTDDEIKAVIAYIKTLKK